MRKLIVVLSALLVLCPAASAAAPPPHRIWDIAGDGTAGFGGDGGPANLAQLNFPQGVDVDQHGNVAVGDIFNGRVRIVDRGGFILTRAAGFDLPMDVAFEPDGSILVADLGQHVVRRIAPGGSSVTTVAGSAGNRGYSGDGGPATGAQLNSPRAVAVLPGGGFLISDGANHRVRRVAPDGTITTVAGTDSGGFSGDGGPATRAQLLEPFGVAVHPDGGYVIADGSNLRVRRVSRDGTIGTIAGTGSNVFSGDGGPATGAGISYPTDVAVAPDGSIAVVDSSANRVRVIDPSGRISTVAGTGRAGYDGDGRDATTVYLNSPTRVAVTPAGHLVVSDRLNQRIRLIETGLVPDPAPPVSTPPPVADPGTPVTPRLAAALSADRLRIRRGRRARLALALTDAAQVTVEVRRRGRRVARFTRSLAAGGNVLRLRKIARRGRYTVVLTARTADGRVAVDRARLEVVR
jgi:NHL repeat-containing protein